VTARRVAKTRQGKRGHLTAHLTSYLTQFDLHDLKRVTAFFTCIWDELRVATRSLEPCKALQPRLQLVKLIHLHISLADSRPTTTISTSCRDHTPVRMRGSECCERDRIRVHKLCEYLLIHGKVAETRPVPLEGTPSCNPVPLPAIVSVLLQKSTNGCSIRRYDQVDLAAAKGRQVPTQ
jgi:hypothetical protein